MRSGFNRRVPMSADKMMSSCSHTSPIRRRAITAAVTTILAAGGLLVAGWTVFEFDRALFVYAESLVLALGFTVYRFLIWLHRPPTAVMFRSAVRAVLEQDDRRTLFKSVGARCVSYFLANRFIQRRGQNRWAAHWPIMVGCLSSLAIVLPLIFGWVWFETSTADLKTYQLMNFGVPVMSFPVDGPVAFVLFHGLVWASFPVVAGCVVALRRRYRDRGDRAVQSFTRDLLPLWLLLAIAITGLLLTVSYSFLGGRAHSVMAALHMGVVCFTLLWVPYSKLFHIPQRSLKLAQIVCHEARRGDEWKCCLKCHRPFAPLQQVYDLVEVQQQLGYRYENAIGLEHFQSVCPRCRRHSLVIAQGRRWARPKRSQVEVNSESCEALAVAGE